MSEGGGGHDGTAGSGDFTMADVLASAAALLERVERRDAPPLPWMVEPKREVAGWTTEHPRVLELPHGTVKVMRWENGARRGWGYGLYDGLGREVAGEFVTDSDSPIARLAEAVELQIKAEKAPAARRIVADILDL